MPQHKSAAKRMRQNERRRLSNRLQRNRMRTLIKRLRTTSDQPQARELFNDIKALLDRLATRRVIHPNKAANYKSQLETFVNRLA